MAGEDTTISRDSLIKQELTYFSTMPDVDMRIIERQINDDPYRVAAELFKRGDAWLGKESTEALRKKGKQMIDEYYSKTNYLAFGLGPIGMLISGAVNEEPKSKMKEILERNVTEGWEVLNKAGVVKQGILEAISGDERLSSSDILNNPVSNFVASTFETSNKIIDTSAKIVKEVGDVAEGVGKNIEYLPYIALAAGGFVMYEFFYKR